MRNIAGNRPARPVSDDRSAAPTYSFPHRPSESGRRLRAVLVDPDPFSRDRLEQLLDEEPGVIVVGACADGREALAMISREQPDLVLLDVALPDIDGFELARRFRRHVRVGTIFVTARKELALQAYEVHALDYVLKPVRRERLSAAVRFARLRLDWGHRASRDNKALVTLLDQREAERQRRARLLIRQHNGAFFVRAGDIEWVEAAGKLVKVHAGKHVHVQRDSLAHIEHELDPDQFMRISRSVIVNLDHIREIQPWFNGEHLIILDSGAQVPSSRHYRGNLRRLLGKGGEH
jgi:two-component system, LytTR family, response regulator